MKKMRTVTVSHLRAFTREDIPFFSAILTST
jgi:hypothetical protein